MAEIGKFFVTIGSKFDSKGMDKARQAIKGVAVAGVAMGAALVAAGLKAAAMAGEQQQAELLLANALSNTSNETGVTLEQLKKYAAQIQAVTTVGDETTLSVMQMGLSMGISADQIEDATTQAIGLSKAYKIDLNASMKMVALARQGEFTMLARYIPQLRDTTDKTKQAAIANEAMAKGFDIAKAEADTYLGKIDQMKNSWGDIVQAIGGPVMEVMTELLDQVKLMLPAFEDWIKKINETRESTKTLVTILKIFINVFIGVIAAFDMMGTAIAAWAATVETAVLKARDKLKFFVPELRWIKGETKIMQDAAKKGWDDLGKKLSEYGKLFDDINKFEIKSFKKKEKTKTGAVSNAEKARLKAIQDALKAKQDLEAMDKLIAIEAQAKYDEAELEQKEEHLTAMDELIAEFMEKRKKLHEDLTETITKGLNYIAEVEVLNLKTGAEAFGRALKERASKWIQEMVIEVSASELANLAIAIMQSAITWGAAAWQIGKVAAGAAAGIAGLRALQTMDEGGIVKGPIGKPVMVQALGGEHFGGRESIGGGDINVYLQPIGTRQEAKRIGKIVGNEIFKKVKKSRRI